MKNMEVDMNFREILCEWFCDKRLWGKIWESENKQIMTSCERA